MCITRGEIMFLLISWFFSVIFAVRYFRNRKQLTDWQRLYRDPFYFALFVILIGFSGRWWRLNVAINTLEKSEGCFVGYSARSGLILTNNGVDTIYAQGKNRKTDPTAIIRKNSKKSDCFQIEYYKYFGVQYVYTFKKINLPKETK
jgi:hypothetical protein